MKLLEVRKRGIALCAVVTSILCLSSSARAQEKTITNVYQNQVAGVGPSQCDADGSSAVNCGWEVQPAFTGWMTSGDPTYTGICSLTDCFQGGLGQTAHSGTWALVTGPTTNLGCVDQAVPTDPSAVYDLSFSLRNMQFPNRFQVSWDGSVIYDQTDMPDFPYTSSATLPVGDPSVFIGLTPNAGGATNLKFCFFNIPDYFFLDDVDVLRE